MRAKQPAQLLVVMTKEEVREPIGHLTGTHRLRGFLGVKNFLKSSSS
jgi:hypothetical protein